MIMLRRLLLVILLLCIALMATVAVVAKSERVGSWLFSSLEEWTGGVVVAAGFEGALLGDFRLDQLVIDTGYERIQFSDLSLHTAIGPELALQLSDVYLDALRITISERPENTDKSTGSGGLPVVYIPLRIVVVELALADFDLTVFDQPILVDLEVSSSAEISGSRIEISSLQTALYEQRINASGSLLLAESYPIDVAVETAITQTSPVTVAHVEITDSVVAPRITITSQGWLEGEALVDLPQWKALGKLPISVQMKLGPVADQSFVKLPEEFEQLTVTRLEVDGTYDAGIETAIAADFELPEHQFSGHLSTDLRTNFQRLWLDSFSLIPANSQSVSKITATGELALVEFAADLNIGWQGLAWPLVSPQYQFHRGAITLKGDLSDFTVLGGGDVSVVEVGSAHASVDIHTVESELTINDLALVGEFGELTVDGRANWGERQDIDVDLVLQGFNLALIDPALQSAISGRAKLQATTADSLAAHLAVQHLGGSFRQMPITGSGDVHYGNSCLAVSGLSVSSNESFLTADGSACTNENLEFDFAVVELGDWLIPELSGDIQGSAQLQFGNELAEMAIVLSSQTQYLGYSDQLSLTNASVQASVALNDEAEALSLNVTADKFEAMHIDVNAVNIAVYGSLAAHQFTISHGEVSPQLHGMDVSGSGSFEPFSWQGRIGQIAIHALREWRLNEPFLISASNQDLMVSPFCLLAPGDAKFCAGIDIQARELQSAELEVASVPIAWASPFLPFLSNADNLIATDIRYQFNPSGSEFFGEASLSGDSLTLVSRGGLLMQAPIRDAQISAQLTGDIISVRGDSLLGENGDFSLDAQIVSPLADPQIEAQLAANLSEFDWLDDTLVGVEELAGKLSLQASAEGPLSAPSVTAIAAIQEGSLALNEYGTRLEQFNTRVALTPNWQISVDGSANMGGDIRWRGDLDVETGDLSLQLTGEELRLAQSTKLSVLASPSLQLVSEQGNLTMTGDIDIIDGNYHLDDAPEVVSNSSDVVYVDEQLADDNDSLLPERLALDFNLNIRPGFRVTSEDFFSDVGGNLALKKPFDSSLRAFGTINISAGEYQVYSSRMPIKSGRISFSGGAIDNPTIDIVVEKKVDDVVVGVEVKGTSLDPTVELYSQPYMSDTERLSYLVFETPPSDDTAAQLAFMQATELIGAGTRVNDILGEATFTISPTKASIGRQLNADFWVGFNYYLDSAGQQSTHSNDDNTEFLVRYRVNNNISLEASMGEDQGIDAYYTLETDDP
ncbi:translocation/assembly module TamB domain-containing protein [Umboniibacter marinipuniceus]|uniref:Autotransporter translocation and assembly factor TamB n=1 Tax=Umboniibacter marinipuniceus TaxID=569599 RepID=A0A3M0A5H8_9GAMM|nr:translocation/assembly module TamB domain-containing protein [Umboniibacter marinipuniceus]RMA80030.1 autotransporter translocation and assembly factor TamB [Umboniibacter marinipuniceus]